MGTASPVELRQQAAGRPRVTLTSTRSLLRPSLAVTTTVGRLFSTSLEPARRSRSRPPCGHALRGAAPELLARLDELALVAQRLPLRRGVEAGGLFVGMRRRPSRASEKGDRAQASGDEGVGSSHRGLRCTRGLYCLCPPGRSSTAGCTRRWGGGVGAGAGGGTGPAEPGWRVRRWRSGVWRRVRRNAGGGLRRRAAGAALAGDGQGLLAPRPRGRRERAATAGSCRQSRTGRPTPLARRQQTTRREHDRAATTVSPRSSRGRSGPFGRGPPPGRSRARVSYRGAAHRRAQAAGWSARPPAAACPTMRSTEACARRRPERPARPPARPSSGSAGRATSRGTSR